MKTSKPDTGFDVGVLMCKVGDCISCSPNNTTECPRITTILIQL